ncbi:hypothetical protein IFO70_27235 [Phormidium tenue FACHB-886]|nr:hypothetical protein [Phormidium tenue FACHB-886]
MSSFVGEFKKIQGTNGNDSLFGGSGNEEINGEGGNDLINGGGGIDIINGGEGIDTVTFAAYTSGVEVAYMGADSFSYFGTGFEGIFDNVENITGSQFNDVVVASNIDNVIQGGGGNDELYGLAGNDILDGGDGNDSLFGGAGNDLLKGGLGSNAIDGGEGNDTVSYDLLAVGVTVDLNQGTTVFSGGLPASDTLLGVENIVGSQGSDILTGNASQNTLAGGAGLDSLTGGGGADRFVLYRRGVDQITDFSSAEGDKIVISPLDLRGNLREGNLSSSQFVRGTRAKDLNDRFIYDQGRGALLYDADGIGPSGRKQIASFANNPALSAADIIIAASPF